MSSTYESARRASEDRDHSGGHGETGTNAERPQDAASRGAGEGIRTLDVHLGKVALYH